MNSAGKHQWLRHLAEQVAVHIEHVAPSIRSKEAYATTVLPGLVRCRSFLRSILNHDRDALHDLLGADLRLLFETFVVTTYALFGGDDARHQLVKIEQTRRSKIGYADQWELAPEYDDADVPNFITFETICQRVSNLLRDQGSQHHQLFIDAYELIYRGESYLNVHPSLQGLGLYADQDESGFLVHLTRPPDVEIPSVRLRLAAEFVTHLAHDVFKEFGMETETIDRLGERLGET